MQASAIELFALLRDGLWSDDRVVEDRPLLQVDLRPSTVLAAEEVAKRAMAGPR